MDKKTPVILDTDIGGDIDDTWALAMLLNSPELDLRLVVTDTGDTEYRAAVTAKFLEVAERTDVPIGIGINQGEWHGPQYPWVADYKLTDYPGTIYQDGVGALIETIMASPEPVTLICIGAVPNIAAALEREPRIAQNARFVGMHGSVYRGYGGSEEISAEANVKNGVSSCRTVFDASWEVTIKPLDTCGLISLEGDTYAKIRDSQHPMMRALMENYRIWAEHVEWLTIDAEVRSSTLFDTVAVYLAFAEDLVKIEELGIVIDDEGYTRIDDSAKVVRCATAWKDQQAFEDLLVQRLLA